MVLRIVLILGCGLVLLAGGAAGWQYFQQQIEAQVFPEAQPGGTTATASAKATAKPAGQGGTPPSQDWLISPGGGLIGKEATQAFLDQSSYSRSRYVSVTFRADLADMLTEGESLPGPVYQTAFAQTRALRLAQGLCAPVLEQMAQECAATEVTLVEDSYDMETASVGFTAVLVFKLKPEEQPLPDLAAHVLETDRIGGEIEQISGRSPILSTLGSTVKLAGETCRKEAEKGRFCRISAIRIEALDQPQTSFAIVYDTLGPMPQGMYPAPPL